MKMNIRKQLQIFFLLLCLVTVTSTKTYAQEQQIVKVAASLDHGFFFLEENGTLSGYNYDYLQQVAQFTGWEYEFILIDEPSAVDSYYKAIELLQAGEVDLLGTVFQREGTDELFEFTETRVGNSRYSLMSYANNYKITIDNYFFQDCLSVALVEGLEINEQLIALFDLRDIQYELIYVDTYEESLELLVNDQVDTLLMTDTSRDSWMFEYLTTIYRNPFYFVAEKGNTALADQLEEAIQKINVLQPDLHQVLLDRYFGQSSTGSFEMTIDEVVALADYDYFTVGVYKNFPPYEIYDEETGEFYGITLDILQIISEMIDIEFRYVPVDNEIEMAEKLENQEIDFCGTVVTDPTVARELNVVLSVPYIQNGTFLLTKENLATEKALYHMVSGNIHLYNPENLTMIFDIESAILDLSKNGANSIFCDPNVAKYYLHHLDVDNIEYQTFSNICSDVGLGMGTHLDVVIMGLFNNAIESLNDFEVEEIIHEHFTFNTEVTFKTFWKEYGYIFGRLGVFLLIILVLVLFLHSNKLKEITQQDSLTKLYNAGYFHKFMEEKSNKEPCGCLILVDIDWFKQVNDTYGHQQGDTIIKRVADILAHYFRPSDVVARLGGDEFIIFLEKKQTAENLGKRFQLILDALAKPEDNIPVSLSIGGYIFDEPIEYEELYQLADKELYKVKEKGRNGFSISS